MKYLLWGLLIYLAWRWFSASQRKEPPGAGVPPAQGPEAVIGSAEKMVRCEHCGVHLPASEALATPDARHYCSEQHRDLHQSQHVDPR